MRLRIVLEPPGSEEEKVRRNWLADFSLPERNGFIEVGPEKCLEYLVDLRNRCYERGLTVNIEFQGRAD